MARVKRNRKRLNLKIAQLKFLAGLLTNLAAGWLGIEEKLLKYKI